MNFFKKPRALRRLQDIAISYIKRYFFFDVASTLPCLLTGETLTLYYLKLIRLAHFLRLSQPLELILSFLLAKYSKKRQNDLSGFCALLLYVIYSSHINACIWLALGMQQECTDEVPGCVQSWVYAQGFKEFPKQSQYIFAFYWIFEVITTVGYGDYTGSTENEYIFSILLEFLGLTFFSFLMGSITSIFSTSDNFDDLIE